MTQWDVHYRDKDTGELSHVEKGYKTLEEAESDAATYLYGYTYEIKEEIL